MKTFGLRPVIFAIAMIASSASAPCEDAPAPKTGLFTTTFAKRSPLSSIKELTLRMKEKKLDPDYDLSKENFGIYVPKGYAPTKPPGILLLLNYKNSTPPGDTILQFCDAHNFIFATTEKADQAPWVKCGLGLDAVYNLGAQFTIDPHRVYLLDFDQSGGGESLAMLFPDVIQGSFICNAFKWWRSIPVKAGGAYPPEIPVPSQKYVGNAKAHALIVAETENPDDHFKLKLNAVRAEGFHHLEVMVVTTEQVHYPHFSSEWMTGAVKFLDENNVAVNPPPKIATRPIRPAP